MLRTIAVEHSNTLRFLLALRAQRSYFNLPNSSHSEVDSVKDLLELPVRRPPKLPWKIFEGLAFYAAIAKVKSTRTIRVFFTANHAVYDGISIIVWTTDLSKIPNRELTVDRPPYKMFADAYYLCQNSRMAEEARDYHAQLFKHIEISPSILWPPGKDLISSQAPTPSISDVPILACIIEHTRSHPSMKEAYTKRSIRSSIIVKMAICFFNYLQTEEPYAIFNMLLSERIRPFMSPDIAAYLPHPGGIAGPTLITLVNITNIKIQVNHCSIKVAKWWKSNAYSVTINTFQ